ncbi:hypothetical protein EVAR_7439_1 [Eumeta japonica]|uniref:Uncharacterized protein n=1 Tax=Eumeta variegata TaxID=151549 RepID=A0A4C1V7E7_EUMVA|nr:hypothetical protein EVAR_7439_1 [Eumeta japonica]
MCRVARSTSAMTPFSFGIGRRVLHFEDKWFLVAKVRHSAHAPFAPARSSTAAPPRTSGRRARNTVASRHRLDSTCAIKQMTSAPAPVDGWGAVQTVILRADHVKSISAILATIGPPTADGSRSREPDSGADDPESMSEKSIAVLTVRLLIEDRYRDPGRFNLIGLNSTRLIGRSVKDESENSGIQEYSTFLHYRTCPQSTVVHSIRVGIAEVKLYTSLDT